MHQLRFLAILVLMICSISDVMSQRKKEVLYVGTFSTHGSKGIYVYEFDRANARLKLIQTIQTKESPTFLEVHPSGKYLYSVNRGSLEEMENAGSVSSFKIDPKSGRLELLNERPSYGSDPCHISIDRTGHWAFVSNYSSGNFVVLPIFDDGLLGSSADSRRHMGKSVHPDRQTKSYVHQALVSPDNNNLIVTDLGADRVYAYRFDPSDGKIEDGNPPFVSVKPGCGPRHFTWHPNGKYGYLVEELSSTVAVIKFDAGQMEIIQDSIVSLPGAYKGENTAADIHTSTNGKFLYMSNRGANALAIFSIQEDGTIALIGQQDTRGKTPRNFLIDSAGQYVMVANQLSDNIVLFRPDVKTGKLIYISTIKNPSPVCLKLLKL